MRPLRRMIAAILRVIDRIVRAWKARDSSLAAAPGTPTVVRAAALRQLSEVVGSATRSFPPADEVLVYFNYELSPFYAELPPKRVQAVVDQASGWSSRLGQSVRWLSHAQARARNGFERASDESRLNLLRELYDEALAEEQRGRVAASPAWMAWMGVVSGGDRTPKKYAGYPSVLNVLEEEEAGEAAGEEAGEEAEAQAAAVRRSPAAAWREREAGGSCSAMALRAAAGSERGSSRAVDAAGAGPRAGGDGKRSSEEDGEAGGAGGAAASPPSPSGAEERAARMSSANAEASAAVWAAPGPSRGQLPRAESASGKRQACASAAQRGAAAAGPA